jgi:phosphatidate cytidylyltransferase
MKKIFKRLIIFFVGLPVLLSLIIFLPHYNHLLLNIAIIVFAALGAVELKNILERKNLVISKPEAAVLGALCPLAWTLVVSFNVTEQIVPGAIVLGATWLLVSGIFTSQEKLDSYISRVTAGFTLMIYPGFLIAWIVRMATFREAGMVMLIFFLVVLLNDSAAWFAGTLFGKGNQGIFAASPKKSAAGFIGGLFASVLTGITATLLIPGAFSSSVMPSTLAGFLLGIFAGAAATLGDLSESAIKRSAGVKDSGSIILGRGGALDSIDSLILAAPVYFLIYRALFDKI